MDWLYAISRFGTARLFRVINLPLVLLSMAFLIGCEREEAARTATPRAAAKAYVTAMNSGDADTLAAVSHGDDASLRLLVSVARANAGYARLEKLATEKFGDPKAVFAYPRARDHYAQMQKEIDSAEERVDGASATIGKGLAAVHLQKVDGKWKVNRGRHVQSGEVSESAIAMSEALAKAYNDVADKTELGAYKTANEAKADLGQTLQAVMLQMTAPTQPAAPGPTSGPASGER